MAGAALVPGRHRGGDFIQARRQNGARLAAAGVALAIAALVGAHAGLAASRWQDVTAVLAGASVVVLGAALWRRRAAGIPAAILLAGAAYGVSIASSDPTFDRASAVVAALLLLAAELGYWSLELAAPIRYEPAILARRLALLTALGLGGLCAAGVVGVAAARDADPSLLLEGVGVGAAVMIVAVLAGLAQGRRGAR